jgi:hypothetical protein
MPPLAPARGIRVDGMLLRWHVSHGVELETGTWAGTKFPFDLGATPSKVPTVTLTPWQPLHPLVMPTWLKAEFENEAPFTTGKFRLELLPTWQFSQPKDPMGIWFPAVVLMEKLADGIAKVEAAAP